MAHAVATHQLGGFRGREIVVEACNAFNTGYASVILFMGPTKFRAYILMGLPVRWEAFEELKMLPSKLDERLDDA